MWKERPHTDACEERARNHGDRFPDLAGCGLDHSRLGGWVGVHLHAGTILDTTSLLLISIQNLWVRKRKDGERKTSIAARLSGGE